MTLFTTSVRQPERLPTVTDKLACLVTVSVSASQVPHHRLINILIMVGCVKFFMVQGLGKELRQYWQSVHQSHIRSYQSGLCQLPC
jgi:hypothetical protein